MGTYEVSGTWSSSVPPLATVAATLTGVSPTGAPVTVPLGASAISAAPPILTVSTENLVIPASRGKATVVYTLRNPDGSPVSGASINVTLNPAPGANLSLSATSTLLTETLTTAANGTANLVVYGKVVPATGTLSAVLSSEAGAVPVLTNISVGAGSAQGLVAPPSELGPTEIPAARGWQRLVFEATDAAGNPISGATVTFSLAIGSTGLTLNRTKAVSSTDGLVDILVYGDTIADEGRVVATLLEPGGSASTVTTGRITVAPGSAARIATSLPPNDSIGANRAAQGLILTAVVEDARGNPVPTPENLTVSSQGVLSVQGPSSVTTNQAGLVSVTLKDAQGTAGTATVTLTGPNGLTTSLPLSAVAGPPAHLTAQPFNVSTVTAGTSVPLSLSATDAYGNPVNGTYEVHLSGPLAQTSPGGDSVTATASQVTFQNGSSVSYAMDPVLAQSSGTLTVAVGPLSTATAQVPGTLTVTAGSPALVTVSSVKPAGSGSAPLLTAPSTPWTSSLTQTLGAPLPKSAYQVTVQVTDQEGNPVDISGVPVSVSLTDQPGEVSGQGATLSQESLSTGASGQAVLTYTSGSAVEPFPAHGDVLSLTLPATGATDTLTTGGY